MRATTKNKLSYERKVRYRPVLVLPLLLGATWALPTAWAQTSQTAAAPETAAASVDALSPPAPSTTTLAYGFDLLVKLADGELRTLIERHTVLNQFRELNDLDANEMTRLKFLAENNIRELLGTQGYFNPRIVMDYRQAGTASGKPVLEIAIEPGQQAAVRSVDIQIQGALADAADAQNTDQRQAIQRDWLLPVDKRFTQDDWSAAKTQALRQLTSTRYLAGRIAASQAMIDAPNHAAALQLRLDSGPSYRLGPLRVKGSQRYAPALAKNLSRLKPGQDYDAQRLLTAQQLLTASGYYDAASVAVDASGPPEAAPVTLNVTEAKLQKVTLGVGYSTDTGPRAFIEHRHNTLPTQNWRLMTKVRWERDLQSFDTDALSVPGVNGWRQAGAARVERVVDAGDLITVSQHLQGGWVKHTERIDRAWTLQYDRSSVRTPGGSPESDATLGDGSALSVNWAWTGRYFQTIPFVQSGQGLRLEAGLGATLSDKRQPFARLYARWLHALPLARSRVLLRAEAGGIVGARQARIPSVYLFRAGGINSVRGYGYRDLGASTDSGTVAPGRWISTASAEWQRPMLTERFGDLLEHTLFIDAGTVANHPRDFKLKLGAGTGVRVKTPVGPMQLDLAYGVQPRRWRLHLNVGFVF